MNAYKILGVSSDASDDEIKRAYRKLALEYHPDRNNTAEAQDKIKEVNEAYDTLNNSSKKREHDAQMHWDNRPNQQSQRFDEFFHHGPLRGFDEFFANIYGHTNRRPYPQQTRIQSETSLKLEEVVTGARRKFSVNGGEYEINIPPGVMEGEVLRAVLDDDVELHLKVNFLPHRIFTERSGIDIYTRIDVPLRIAIAGGEVQAPTLNGRITLTIPKGTSSHTKLRAADRGLWRKSEMGDAFYEVRIKVPSVDESAAVVIEQLLENQSDE